MNIIWSRQPVRIALLRANKFPGSRLFTFYFLLIMLCWTNAVHCASPRIAGLTTSGTLIYPNQGITVLGRINLTDQTDRNLYSIGLDAEGKHAFYYSEFGQFVKVALEDRATTPGGLVAAITMPESDKHYVNCALLDPTGGYAYLGVINMDDRNRYGRILKFALGKGDAPPRYIGMTELQLPGWTRLVSGGVDSKAGYAYFSGSNYGIGGPIIKVAMNPGNTSPTLVGSTYLLDGDDYISQGVIDPQAGCCYFYGGYGDPVFVMVGLGQGNAKPYRIGQIRFGNPALGLALLNKSAGHIYVFENCDSYSGRAARFHKFKLAQGLGLPGYLGYIETAQPTENWTGAGILDPQQNTAFLRANEYGAKASILTRINLGAGDALPTRLGATKLPEGDLLDPDFFLDSASGYTYGALSYTDNLKKGGKVIRLAHSANGIIHATRFTMPEHGLIRQANIFSHRAAGSFRMAIYSDEPTTKTLLWQSAPTSNTVANDWLTLPVSAGKPSRLVLRPGTYFLAWQTDTSTDVASYVKVPNDDGLYLAKRYGDYPTTLSPDSPTSWTSTAMGWSTHITFEPWNSAKAWHSYH